MILTILTLIDNCFWSAGPWSRFSFSPARSWSGVFWSLGLSPGESTLYVMQSSQLFCFDIHTKCRGRGSRTQLICITRRRAAPKEQCGKNIAHSNERNHKNCDLQLVVHQIRDCVRAIADCQVPDSKVAKKARNRNRRRVTEQRHFKPPCRKHEKFERRRRRQ